MDTIAPNVTHPPQLTAFGNTTGQLATVQTKHGRRAVARVVLAIRGAKAEAAGVAVPIEQSQVDRSKKLLVNQAAAVGYDGYMSRMTVRV